jgi:uncharacterized membrane protein
MRKTIAVVGAVLLIALACVAVFGSGNTTNADYPENRSEFTSVSGIVRGYTTHNGFNHVTINAVSYKIKGISTSDLESMIGSEITIRLLNHGNYYEYIGIEHPIKEEVISTSMSEDDIEMLNFCDWLEQKHPILNNFLWRRYNRVNV